jgi:TorA maturation chaperone TorD
MMLSIVERAPIYGWLSGFLVREIDEARWIGLGREPIRGLLSRAEPGFHAWSASPFTEEIDAALAEEYARLFLLPEGVSPFVSTWLDGDREQLSGSLASMVERGLVVLAREPVRREPWGRLPLDHLACVFDVVSESIASGEPMQVEVAIHLDTELLGPWLVSFGERVRTLAETPFYRAIGSIITELHCRAAEGAGLRTRRA